MSPDTLPSSALTDWPELFADWQRHLDKWLEQPFEGEAEPLLQADEPAAALMFAERLQQLQAHLDRAEKNAEQVLEPLAVEIQSLRQWLETLNAARRRLAERASSETH